MRRGYFGIGIFHPKTSHNVGTLWRSAHCFDADFLFTVGRRYKEQASDTTKAQRHVPLYHFLTFEEFNQFRPQNCPLIGLEQVEGAFDLAKFIHPERAVYLLGAEDYGLPKHILRDCQAVVQILTPMPLNVATVGSIVMYDRATKTAGRKMSFAEVLA